MIKKSVSEHDMCILRLRKKKTAGIKRCYTHRTRVKLFSPLTSPLLKNGWATSWKQEFIKISSILVRKPETYIIISKSIKKTNDNILGLHL